MSESKILTSEEVAEYERDIELSSLATFPMSTEQMRALCATVRHLMEENRRLEHHNQLCEKAFELDTAIRLPEVGNLNILQIVKKMNALTADVARFSGLADKRHDELCAARRQRDDLAAKCAPYLEQLK